MTMGMNGITVNRLVAQYGFDLYKAYLSVAENAMDDSEENAG